MSLTPPEMQLIKQLIEEVNRLKKQVAVLASHETTSYPGDAAVKTLVGAMVDGNTETGIAVTYQSSDSTIDFALDDEYLQDIAGAMVSGNTETGIAVTYDDSSGKLNFDAQTAGDARYLRGSGSYTNGGLVITHYSEDVGDITSTQALTIQVTSGAARRLHITDFYVACARGATNNVYAFLRGPVIWTWETGGATTIRDSSGVVHGTSGVDACTITTITNGIQIVIDSSAFGNTLDSNALFIRNVSETAIAVVTSIA